MYECSMPETLVTLKVNFLLFGGGGVTESDAAADCTQEYSHTNVIAHS